MESNNIGNIIKDIRKKYNLTQDDLAKKLNVTYQAVSKWENNKSIPDIEILNNISKLYNIDINILLGNKKKHSKKIIILTIIIILVILLSIIFIFIKDKPNHNFELKTISSTCEEFKITGSAAYNQDKASIIISNISYCGEEDNTKYKNIKCSLYEENNKENILISDCSTSEENITLESYLNNIKINVSNYNFVCKEITSTTFYLEIKAYTKTSKVVEYKIPLEIEDNC